MSLDNRRNLDFAFPSFAPGLPSVYERAGFDVKQSARSMKSSKSLSKGSQYTKPDSLPSVGTPGLPHTPQSLNSFKFQAPPLPSHQRAPNSAPSSAPNLSASIASSAPPQPPAPTPGPYAQASTPASVPPSAPAPAPYHAETYSPPQEIPPRSASRGPTLPLITRKSSSVSHTSSGSMQSNGSSFSQSCSAGSDTTQSSAESAPTNLSTGEFQFNDYKSDVQGYLSQELEFEAHDHFLSTPAFDKNRFSSTSSVYSSADPRRSQARGLRENHPTLPTLPSINDGPLCPYPDTPTPEQAHTPLDQLPEMPPKAPDHAKRVSTIQKSDVHTHSSSSSQSSGFTHQRNDKVCRQCSQLITGKSVYSKDGVMSGRWHKACFVCTDCQSPLSSEVYVLMDSPYCNACYHQANKSICRSCGEGIEGLCLEGVGEHGEDPMRYHPSCLECDQCNIKLSDIYYEAGGRTYCEMHGANAKQARRRTTRLLMND